MRENDVDESQEPISIKQYWGKKKVMEAYDTKYLRAGVARSQEIFFEAYRLNFFERFILLLRNIIGMKSKEVSVDKPVDNVDSRSLIK